MSDNEETCNYDFPSVDLPDLNRTRSSNGDFMTDLIIVTNEVNKKIILVSGIVTDKNLNSQKINILRGHLVRLYKLYDSYLFLTVEKRTEIALIILRTLSEAVINFGYLIKHYNTDVFEKYMRVALVYDLKLKSSIRSNQAERQNTLGIEDRMLKSIEDAQKRSGISAGGNDVSKTKWGLQKEHLNTEGKAKDTGLEAIYKYIFTSSSDNIHGSWHELDFHHLKQSEDASQIRDLDYSYTVPKPQMLESISIVITDVLIQYINLICSDCDDKTKLQSDLDKIKTWLYGIASKHEDYLSTLNTTYVN